MRLQDLTKRSACAGSAIAKKLRSISYIFPGCSPWFHTELAPCQPPPLFHDDEYCSAIDIKSAHLTTTLLASCMS